MKTLIIILMGLIVACSPQKRLNRLVQKHPELIQKDSIHFIDSVEFITNHVQHDTVVTFQSLKTDTLIITKENLRIKTFYNYQTDSIYIFGECESDTITKVIETYIPIDKYVITKESKINYTLVGMCIIFAVLFVLMGGLKLGR